MAFLSTHPHSLAEGEDVHPFPAGWIKAWVCCRLCGEAEVLRSADADLLPPEERQEALVSFLEQHAGHPVTQLVPTAQQLTLHSGPFWEPRTSAWTEVTDGRRIYLLECIRPDVSQPRRYRLHPGRLVRRTTQVDFDSNLALQAWTRRFPSSGCLQLGQRLIAFAQEIVAGLDASSVPGAFDDPDHPHVTFAAWPAPFRTLLLRQGWQILPSGLHPEWEDFVAVECEAHGTWSLRLRTIVEIIEEEPRIAAPL
ncbi:MAG: hypothetical protein N3C12_08990 [Candidatus Binatia bacterium]|nr:hypothetical protein [Candidatus Binatia bacterium]